MKRPHQSKRLGDVLARWVLRLHCATWGHEVYIIRPVSRQTALVRCSRCHRLYAAKMEGEHKGAVVSWQKAESFYRKFSGSLLK